MEYYESKCQSCGHRWQWVGQKTAWSEEQAVTKQAEEAKQKVCPQCKGEAKIGLDHTSPEAVELNGIIRGWFGG